MCVWVGWWVRIYIYRERERERRETCASYTEALHPAKPTPGRFDLIRRVFARTTGHNTVPTHTLGKKYTSPSAA